MTRNINIVNIRNATAYLSINMNLVDLYLIILPKFGDYSVVEIANQPVWLW